MNGDILNCDGEPWVVFFEYGEFVGTFDNVCCDLCDICNYEIIGNIYDNPELLGGE